MLVFIPIPKKGNAKECSNYCTIALISHASKSENKNEICSVVSDSLQPHGLYSPWTSPGHSTGMCNHYLLQGIFPTQGSNPGLPHCRQNLYQLNQQGSSNASKVTFKIVQAMFQQYVNWTLPDVPTGFRKGRGTRDQIPNIRWIIEESSRKTSISALLTMPKPLTVWITINCGKFWKRWEYLTTWPASWETYMQVRKQQLELVMEQQTGPK